MTAVQFFLRLVLKKFPLVRYFNKLVNFIKKKLCKKTDLLGFSFLIIYISYVNFTFVVTARWMFSGIEIGRSYRENGTVVTETQGRDTRVVTMKLTQTLFVETVPYVNITVRATGCERIISRVKTYRVYWIDLLNVIFLYPVTLERIFLLLGFRCRVKIFHGYASLDTAQNVPLKMREFLVNLSEFLKN